MKDDRRETAREGEKRPYRKPELKEVPLRPEEAVLGNCKTSGVSGPATTSCGTFVCSSVGS